MAEPGSGSLSRDRCSRGASPTNDLLIGDYAVAAPPRIASQERRGVVRGWREHENQVRLEVIEAMTELEAELAAEAAGRVASENISVPV